MKNFFSAVRFLTILPLGRPEAFDPKGMIPFFPMVGILLGLMLSALDWIIGGLWPQPITALLDVIFLIILTGAFHLDGLGDTADGLLGHRSKEKMLAIMKDSRIGTMGLVAIICVLAVKWGGILNLGVHRSLLLVIIPGYARASLLFGIRFLRYARPEEGTGRVFFGEPLKLLDFSGIWMLLALSLFLGWKAIWLNAAFFILTAAILTYFKKRMGGITGDMLGAMTEVMESMLFLLIAAGDSL